MSNDTYNNLIDSIFNKKWVEISSFLNGAHFTDESGYTSLNWACHQRDIPENCIQEIFHENPEAASKQDEFGYCPLHWAIKYSNESAILFLVKAEPSVVEMIDLNGNTPLHLALRYQRSFRVLQALVNAQPLAVFIRNKNDESPLDIFFHQMYNDVKAFMNNLPNNSTPKEMIQMNISSSGILKRSKVLKVGEIYKIVCLLLKASMGEVLVNEEPWIALHAALKTSSCPWLFCEFIARIHPDQISMLDNEGNSSLVLAACNMYRCDDSEQKLQSLFTLVAENPQVCIMTSSNRPLSLVRTSLTRKYSNVTRQ